MLRSVPTDSPGSGANLTESDAIRHIIISTPWIDFGAICVTAAKYVKPILDGDAANPISRVQIVFATTRIYVSDQTSGDVELLPNRI